MITAPQQSASDYGVVPDSPDATPSNGTTVQAGWDFLSRFKKNDSEYPQDFKMSEETQLIAFLDDSIFHEYYLFWLDGKEGKKSYVAQGTADEMGKNDPLYLIAGAVPRWRGAFNIVNFTANPAQSQILHAGQKLAIQLGAIGQDERRGPLSRSLWAVTRRGTGTLTSYDIDRVRLDELDVWGINAEDVRSTIETAKRYTPADIYVASYEEHERIARELVSR
jgi:hypothetical protein